MTYEDLLLEMMLKDERIIVLTAENRAAIRNLPSKIKERFIDVGIAEQTMVGMAAGFALRGRIPVVHSLSAFLTMRSFEFIRTDIGIANLNVKLVGGFAGFLSEANGPTHQAIEDISLMRGIPNINIFSPSDLQDLLICLPEIINSPAPFYIRYTDRKAVAEHQKEYTVGKGEIISEGEDVTFISYGILLNEVTGAKSILEESGLSVGILNLRTPKPLDEEAVLKVCRHSALVVTVEDHFLSGGIYSILSELLVRNRIDCNVLPVALENKWFKPALLNNVLEFEGFTSNALAEKVKLRLRENTLTEKA